MTDDLARAVLANAAKPHPLVVDARRRAYARGKLEIPDGLGHPVEAAAYEGLVNDEVRHLIDGLLADVEALADAALDARLGLPPNPDRLVEPLERIRRRTEILNRAQVGT